MNSTNLVWESCERPIFSCFYLIFLFLRQSILVSYSFSEYFSSSPAPAELVHHHNWILSWFHKLSYFMNNRLDWNNWDIYLDQNGNFWEIQDQTLVTKPDQTNFKVLDHFGPIGPQTWRSVDPLSVWIAIYCETNPISCPRPFVLFPFLNGSTLLNCLFLLVADFFLAIFF